jgi:hypothetical protein
MGSKRFARLGKGFSKKIRYHLAAVSLHVAFYNLCRSHEGAADDSSYGAWDHRSCLVDRRVD